MQLDKQLVTHGNAGNFLQTMKTLMAKLKVLFFFADVVFSHYQLG